MKPYTCIEEDAVSEILGALLLIAIVSLAVSIIAVTILSGVDTSQTPSLSIVILNNSQNILIFHDGGDPLPAGSYRIYVDDIDRTNQLTPPASSTQFKAGTVLSYTGSTFPRTVMVVARSSDGKETLLVQKYFS